MISCSHWGMFFVSEFDLPKEMRLEALLLAEAFESDDGFIPLSA